MFKIGETEMQINSAEQPAAKFELDHLKVAYLSLVMLSGLSVAAALLF
ncbi:MAG: hypothetical protein AAGA38_17745 [Pseudomonadota bacterium]